MYYSGALDQALGESTISTLHLSFFNTHGFFLSVEQLEISLFETCVFLHNLSSEVLEEKNTNT